jgi:hypothetical protein
VSKARRLAVRSPRRNIASATIAGHRPNMRRYLTLSLALPLAACMRAPQQAPAPQSTPVVEAPRQTGELRGLTANELVGHFGTPALQIREGTSLKLQFRGRRCVLDAYLYPQDRGTLRVTHVDTRSPNGADMDQAACISSLENPS